MCSEHHRYEKVNKRMPNIRSSYELADAVPYLRAMAKFRLKSLVLLYVFFLLICCNYSTLSLL